MNGVGDMVFSGKKKSCECFRLQNKKRNPLPNPRSFLGVGVDGRPNLATVFDNCSGEGGATWTAGKGIASGSGCGTFEDEEGKGPSNNSSTGASATSLSGDLVSVLKDARRQREKGAQKPTEKGAKKPENSWGSPF
jgi:hypothetical protein